jgi:hypothetical protein
MKKIVLASLLATGLMAAGNENYFGINVGNAKMSFSASANGTAADGDTDGTQYTATLGHYYGNTGRISAAYTYVKHDAGVDNSDAISFAYDFILPIAENKFSLYAGPVIGYTRYKEPGLDLSGFHYGAQAGTIVKVMDNIELEAGYRFLLETGSDTIDVSGTSVKVDADNVKMWYVGANFRF